jgi:glutamate 5-kinase
VARRAGADVVIASGHVPDVLRRLVDGEEVGTRFPALETPLDSRKRWILAGPAPTGHIVIDAGAAQALREQGGSLLPAGIVAVEGAFERGDSVVIQSPAGHALARGIARYGANALTRLQGCHSSAIAERLGYAYGPVAVHRDDLILL